ncbi:hypothetical protein Ccrd_013672, partial [Cynara cardunculus var. scolymus]
MADSLVLRFVGQSKSKSTIAFAINDHMLNVHGYQKVIFDGNGGSGGKTRAFEVVVVALKKVGPVYEGIFEEFDGKDCEANVVLCNRS